MTTSPDLRRVDPYERRGRVYLAVCRFSASRTGMWLARRIAWKLDRYLLKLTGGRLGTTGPVASALLETRGARTGKPRRNATLYFNDDDRVIVIAANQGRPAQPAWYHDLCADPEVVFGGLPFRAEVVEDEAERQRLWGLAVRIFPQFDDFREWAAKARRVIPIVRLVAR